MMQTRSISAPQCHLLVYRYTGGDNSAPMKMIDHQMSLQRSEAVPRICSIAMEMALRLEEQVLSHLSLRRLRPPFHSERCHQMQEASSANRLNRYKLCGAMPISKYYIFVINSDRVTRPSLSFQIPQYLQSAECLADSRVPSNFEQSSQGSRSTT